VPNHEDCNVNATSHKRSDLCSQTDMFCITITDKVVKERHA